MTQQAGWIVDEKAVLARDRREGTILGATFFRRARLPVALTLLLTGLLAASVFLGVDLFLFAVAALCLGSIPLAHLWETRLDARRAEDLALKEALGSRQSWLVELLIHQGAAVTGTDRGVVWFEDGRMYFSGHRTSFGLTPESIAQTFRAVAPIPGLTGEVGLILQAPSKRFPFAISLTNLDSSPTTGELMQRIAFWREKSGARGGQWPPQDVGPGASSGATLLLRALAASFVAPFAVALVVGPLGGTGISTVAFLVAFCLTMANEKVAFRWRALRDRRRLRRLG